MLNVKIDLTNEIIIIEPESSLEQQDFQKMA